ncbi:MAG TPA: methyltransferase domain-containing protein [Silvibacterium sp.]|nr:methyltransferase domain-containing protein [Silvibacterium sp.]
MSTHTLSGAVPSIHQRPAFDLIARDYDRIFTHSVLGKAQRSLVHEALRPRLRTGQRVLDLNCGTGEDAVFLASLGMSVFACDISEGMIEIARRKAGHTDHGSAIDFAVCANEHLESLADHAPFDVVLSNFGGLNCTDDLAHIARGLSQLVRPGGEVFLCVLGRVCAWEILWYSVRGNWRKAFRRIRPGGTEARISGASLRVHYPSVREMRHAFAPSFTLESWRGIGVAVPPSWLASAFHARPRVVELLKHIDRCLGVLPMSRGLADHILFHFVRERK